MSEDWSSILEQDLQKLSEVAGVQPVKTVQLIPGERRDVAILFLDLKGFTAMSETVDHEMVHKVVNGVMLALSNVVKRQKNHPSRAGCAGTRNPAGRRPRLPVKSLLFRQTRASDDGKCYSRTA